MNYQYDTFVNVPINMRHEGKILTDEFGINVIYVRHSRFVKCSCFDDLNKIGNPDCPKCFGSGWFASMQKIRAIESRSGVRPYSSNSNITSTPIGTTNEAYEVFYIHPKYNPKQRDFLLKVTWKNDYPIDIVAVYEIINVWEMRGDDGRNELNGCVIDDRTDLVKPYTKALKSLPPKALYQMSKGGKSIWPYMTSHN